MDYDVRIATTADGYEKLVKYVEDMPIPEHEKHIGKGYVPGFGPELHGDSVVFGWDNIPWENYFQDIHDALEELADDGIPYKVVSIDTDGGYVDTEDNLDDCDYELDVWLGTMTTFDIYDL